MFRLSNDSFFFLNGVVPKDVRDEMGQEGKNWEALVGFEGQEGRPLVCSVAFPGALPPRMADRNLSLHSELHLPYAVIDVAN